MKKSLSFDCLESKVSLSDVVSGYSMYDDYSLAYSPTSPLVTPLPEITEEEIHSKFLEELEAEGNRIMIEGLEQHMQDLREIRSEMDQTIIDILKSQENPVLSPSPEKAWYEVFWDGLGEVFSAAGDAHIPVFHP